MPKARKCRIFISHASEDQKLAEQTQKLFVKSLGLKKADVFCSSDDGSIRFNESGDDAITDAIKSAQAVVALITPNSAQRAWVLFEAGGAYFSHPGGKRKDSKLFLTYGGGIEPRSFPAPLSPRHAADLRDKRKVKKLLEQVAERIKSNSPSRVRDGVIQSVCKLASTGGGGWEFVSQAFLGHKVADSPFDFEKLLSQAKKEVFTAGPSLSYITGPERARRFKSLIFQKLAKRGFKIRFMVADPNCKWAVDTVSRVAGGEFRAELERSVKVLGQWKKGAKTARVRLDARLTVAVLLPITFVDPEDDSGVLVFNPIVYRANPRLRPCFRILKKDHNRPFDYYWKEYQRIFEDSHMTRSIDSTRRCLEPASDPKSVQ